MRGGGTRAAAQGVLHLRHGGFGDTGGRVEDNTRDHIPLHFLKHPIDHTHMEVHVLVAAGVNRWMKATAPMCSADLLPVPELCACRVCAITRKKMRSTMASTAPSRCAHCDCQKGVATQNLALHLFTDFVGVRFLTEQS